MNNEKKLETLIKKRDKLKAELDAVRNEIVGVKNMIKHEKFVQEDCRIREEEIRDINITIAAVEGPGSIYETVKSLANEYGITAHRVNKICSNVILRAYRSRFWPPGQEQLHGNWLSDARDIRDVTVQALRSMIEEKSIGM